jgi:peptidoglycan/xylan/chitin deacetylase (PgdA/CDA1 family)
VLVALIGAVLLLPAAAFGASTVVSLSFDDGWANQTEAQSTLAAHNMRATFFINSNNVGAPNYLTWSQIEAINSNGHEIAGHTLDHVGLWQVSDDEARRQICEDRQNILARGFVLTSFAYPGGDFEARHETMVRDCGYSSGRGAYGLRRLDQVIPGDNRPFAERVPPVDKYAIRTPCCINSTVSLSTLQNYIVNAENAGGGWVPLVLHRVCTNCGDSPAPSITPATLDGLLTWLAGRTSRGTVVKTVSQVISGDDSIPTSAVSCNGGGCSTGWYGSAVSVALSSTDTGSGVSVIRYTLDGSEPTVSSSTYTGSFVVPQTATIKYRAWDNAGNIEATQSQLVRIDTTAPVSTIACDGSACGPSPYASSVNITLSASDSEADVAAIRYTLDGSEPSETSAVYSGPFAVSETTTIRYRAWDNAGNVEATQSQVVEVEAPPEPDTTAPISSIGCGGFACSSGWYGAAVTVTLAATDDDSGVAAIRYTLDGSEPTETSAAYSGAFTVSQTTTVRYRAWDNADNVEATRSQFIQVDTAAPTGSISCNDATCATGWYRAAVTVELSANDPASGVAAIRYTLDGSEPTETSPTYSGPLTVSQTMTVKFRAWDNAGNPSGTQAQLIRVDATAPSVAITAPSEGATVKGIVKITAVATDAGSGVAKVSFYANGVLIGSKTDAPYSVNWNTKKLPKGPHTLTAVAQDVAGNTQTSAALNIKVG